MATKASPRPGTPRGKPSGWCPSSTSSHIIIFLCVFSFISLFYISHESSSSFHLRNSGTEAHLQEIERLVSKLEREVAKIEAKKGELEHGVNHDTKETADKGEEDKEDVEAELIAEPEQLPEKVFVDPNSEKWAAQLKAKLLCLRLRKGALYLYHVRKAAGTSLRDVLHMISLSWKVNFFETEGVVLDHSIFDHQGVTSVLTLREPISRILSLYWYEHVGWFDGILKQTSKCKTLSEWVAAWKDGTPWKTEFINKNPGTVYVEIENYYVKMLIGWKDPNHKIDEKDLEEAKVILSQFDFVFLTDWMGDDTQIDALNAVFPGRSNVAMGHKIRGDHNARTRLTPTLAADEVKC